MPRNSRIPDTYRRRLRLSSRDVLVAAALTALAGGVVVAALWKAPSPGAQFPEAAVSADGEP
jgi:ferric-dicitrate binding protein FerR (iron transport regulator)